MPPLVDTALFHAYREARSKFLRAIGCADSCRDPFAEFSERLVCQQLGGTLASSRVQKGYDLSAPGGERVQVKYLANPAGAWRNEHLVQFSDDIDIYALVIYEAFEVSAIITFQRSTIASVCGALRKRHPKQEFCLAFTRANFQQILSERESFSEIGVECFTRAATGAATANVAERPQGP